MRSAIVLWLVLFSAGTVRGEDMPSVSFDSARLRIEPEGTSIRFADLPRLPMGIDRELPAARRFIRLRPGERVDQLAVNTETTVLAEAMPVPAADIATSEPGRYGDIRPDVAMSVLNDEPVYVVGERVIGQERFAELLIFPVTSDRNGRWRFHHRIDIFTGSRHVSPEELLTIAALPVQREAWRFDRLSTATGGGQPEFIIITNDSLAAAFERLARYRTTTGLRSQVIRLSEILPDYSGEDSAARLREYLKEAHSQGVRFVLLGGDETVVPVRYAYHLNASAPPPLEYQQICDLYHADLTGEWDTDGDGIYGEKHADSPDLTPELLVGRLPVSRPEEVAAYVTAVITYETNPGQGAYDYLTRTLYFSSDQMRDYPDGGQHGRIQRAFPSWFTADTVTAVEAMRGDDPVPVNLPAAQIGPLVRDGYGIVHIIAHGRADGFPVRTAGYNNWPKSYLLTEGVSGDHAPVATLFTPGKPAFYYSLACDHGGFDFDRPPLSATGRTFCQELFSYPDGAVGLVAYSRWGWVSTSYKLQQAFFDSLFAHPDRPASAAMYAVKQAFAYHRDLVYGQNYYGDPTVRLYTGPVSDLTVQAVPDEAGTRVAVTDEKGPVAGAMVSLAADGELIETAMTAGDGAAVFGTILDPSRTYTISARAVNHPVAQVRLAGSIVTGVDDDKVLLPATFALQQNYPNPFNPSTTIPFELSRRSEIVLEVLNLLGQRVALLAQGTFPAGRHVVEWNGRDDHGRPVASGVYFYRLDDHERSRVRTMVLVR